MMPLETEVLIVGAGPVGMALAIELGMRGISALLIERNDRVGTAPRAKTTNVRTRTHLRRWGIADKLAAAAPFGVDYPNNMVFVTRLSGHELARFTNAFNASPVRDDRYPEHGQWVPQYTLEKILLDRVRELPSIGIRFETSFRTATQDGERVTSTIVGEDGREATVVSRYLIGADGARSMVRALIGAKMEGHHGITHAYNIIFRAPGLAQAHKHGPAAVYWQISKDGFSAISPMDKDDRWAFGLGATPDTPLSPDEAAALIRDRTGIDLPFEVLSADSWVASELLASRYADRRIILAGDACHLHPPAGGYGMNMGIGDAVDLGWKIAATLQGWGGSALVDSYEGERRAVHRAVLDEAMANFQIYVAPPPSAIEDDTPEGAATRAAAGAAIQASKAREFDTLGTVLGLCYRSPLIVAEEGPDPVHDSQVYQPSARPGCLAPHAWLPDGRSLYDSFGSDFTLLVSASADPAEIALAEADAATRGIPLKVVRAEGVDIDDLYEAALTLIRPDQHVAWRGERWRPVLAQVSGALEPVATP